MPPVFDGRRRFLQRMADLTALSALTLSIPGLAESRHGRYPFGLGVGSGSPRPESVLLWTRLVNDGIVDQALQAGAVRVKWELAEDEHFKKIATRGEVAALPELAHSVHVEATGLQPDRWYWYRFTSGDAVSPTGRTRTAPARTSFPQRLKFAVASCQHWEFGHYAAHRHIAAAAPDLVVFLGDYIYEWGPYDLTHPVTPRRTNESLSLQDYRSRYAQYKSDKQLQSSHHAAPWIVTWDDHEVVNDYAGGRDERMDADFVERRAAAYQAFYEHMPVRLSALPSGPHPYAHLQIHDRFDWGQLARFHVLDDRQYRSPQACPRPGRGGSNSVDRSCTERMDASRTMLGNDQEAWLARGFASSTSTWNFLAQQTLMAQCSQTPVLRPGDGRFWTDGWDGYPAARDRLMRDLAKHRPANPVVLSGDVHTFYATELRRDFYSAADVRNPVLATEFCGTSISSSSRPQSRTDQYVAQNPHIKYGRSDRRGFMLLEASPSTLEVSLMGLVDVSQPDSAVESVAGFTVTAGEPGLKQMR